MTTGEKLKILRHQAGLTQFELEAAIKKKYKSSTITRNDIASWESDRHVPYWPSARILVQFFNITLDNLFFENNTAFLKLKPGKKNLKAA